MKSSRLSLTGSYALRGGIDITQLITRCFLVALPGVTSSLLTPPADAAASSELLDDAGF